MKIIETAIEGPVIIEPDVFGDARGYFFESWSQPKFDAAVRPVRFVQDNESKSTYGVLRGLHFQRGEHAQSKLVRVVSGRVLDAAARRPSAATYAWSSRARTDASSSCLAASPTASRC